MRDAHLIGYLAGPFPAHQEAIDLVPTVRAKAESVNTRAVFYDFGTCRFAKTMRRPGRLNDLLGLKLGEGAPL